MKKYLIMGGTGFIGRNMAEHLLSQGHAVAIIDNGMTSDNDTVSRDLSQKYDKLMFSTESRQTYVEAMVDWCDYIIHLAASVGVQFVEKNPLKVIENNLAIQKMVFDANDLAKKPLLFASTSEVYGNTDELPFKETQDLNIGAPTNGRWSYATTKLMGEFDALHRNFPTVIVRFFNVAGRYQSHIYGGMVIPNFVHKLCNDEPLQIYGDGKQTRCFIHVSDVVYAISKLIVEDKCYGEIFNIGNPDNYTTIANLAETMVNNFATESTVEYIPYDKKFKSGGSDITKRVPDITKIKSYINWEPKETLLGIIEDAVLFYGK